MTKASLGIAATLGVVCVIGCSNHSVTAPTAPTAMSAASALWLIGNGGQERSQTIGQVISVTVTR